MAQVELWEDLTRNSLVPTIPQQETACCVFTSGSTGQPKGVLVSHADLWQRVQVEAKHFQLTSADVLLSILPFCFDVGINQVLSSLVAGCEIAIVDSWLPQDILAVVQNRCVTGIPGTPAIWQDFITTGKQFDRSPNGPHASLRYITISGADLLPEQLDAMPRVVDGADIYKTYGQSEDYRSTCLPPGQYHQRTRSVGKPFAGVNVYIVDADGNRLGPNQQGEVIHSGVGTMQGYLDSTSDEKLRPNPFRGDDDQSEFAVFTGDEGYIDDDGYLYLCGRRDAMLKINGNRVYPEEVAGLLLQIDGVLDAGVVGLKLTGESPRLVAFVVCDASADLDEPAVIAQMNRIAPTYMVPKHVQFKNSLPTTGNAKIDRQALIAEATEKFGCAEDDAVASENAGADEELALTNTATP